MTALRTIGRLARASPRLYAATATLIILAGYLLPLLPGLLVRQVIDALDGGVAAGWNAATLLVLLAVVAVGWTLTDAASGVAEPSLSLVAATLLRRNLLQRLLERPGALPDSPGEAIGRLRNDVAQVAEYVPWTADPLGQALAFILGLAVLASVDAPLALLVCALLLVVAVVGSRAVARLEAYRKASQEAIGQVTGLLGELFGAVLAIKAAGAERRVVTHLEAINEQQRRAGLRDQVYTQGFVGLAQNAASVGAGLLLLVAAGSMRSGSFTVGDFALFVSYLGSLAQAAGWLGVYLTRYQQMGVSLGRLRALLPADGAASLSAAPLTTPLADSAPADALTARAPLYLRRGPPALPDRARAAADRLERLEVRGLTAHHPGSGRGIEGIDLTIERGTLTVVTGRVGAGKTTLLRALLGFLPLEDGEIRWNGRRVDDPARFFVPPRSAYTAQAPHLFGETLRANILMGLPDDADRLARAMQAAVLERDLAVFAHGLDTLVGARGVQLSGGQRQRAAAARMFARDPELLVLDDLASALDVETEQQLWERLAARRAGAVLAIAHRRAALQRADQIVVLVDGRVADRGPLAVLLDHCAELRRLWELG